MHLLPIYENLEMKMEREFFLDKHSLFPSPKVSNVVVRGFHHNADKAVSKNANFLRWLFSPAVKVVSQANENYFLHSSSSDFVIGVHIRHRDFKDWKKGSFFFETTYYAEVMQKILLLVSTEKVEIFTFLGQ